MSALANERAEENLLGALLQDSEAVKCFAPSLSALDFTTRQNRDIFTAIRDLSGTAVDITTVMSALEAKGAPRSMAAVLTRLCRETPTTVNARAYFELVKQAGTRRTLADMGNRLTGAAGNALQDTHGIVDSFRQELRDMVFCGGKWMTAGMLASKTHEHLEAAASGKLRCIKSGIPDLDWLTGGFFPGELTVIGARPGVGKSAFALSIMLEACKAGNRVALVSREMSPEQIGQRMVSRHSDIAGDKLRKGNINPDDWVQVTGALDMLAGMPFHTCYKIRTVEDLWLEAQSLYDAGELDMLIVDYLQLMHTQQKKAGRTEELEAISNALKDIALELNIPVIALAQVRRNGTRGALMPVPDELKGSGAIEQDADVIIFLHHPEDESDRSINPLDIMTYRAVEARGEQFITVDVAKNRQGSTGGFGMVFAPAHMTCTSIAR